MLKIYLKIAFDELCCFNSSLHIEADVHFHLRFMVSKLDDWHLRTGHRVSWKSVQKVCETINISWFIMNYWHNRFLILLVNCVGSQSDLRSLLVTYCSFVEDLDGIWASHVVFLQGLFQFLQWGMVPLSKHHQVNVTENKNTKFISQVFCLHTVQWYRGHWKHNIRARFNVM